MSATGLANPTSLATTSDDWQTNSQASLASNHKPSDNKPPFNPQPSNEKLPDHKLPVDQQYASVIAGVHTPKSTLPADATRHEYRLDNGLQVIIKEDHRAPVVMTQVWYHVGSADEPADKGGMSHLLEHMMFKGTHTVSGSDFDRLIAKFGGNNNAFTSHDYTGYYELLPANRLSLALELEADRMVNLDIDGEQFAAEFAKEQKVVMEERRQRTDDNPIARASEAFRLLAMPDSPKGRPVIGPMQQITNITLTDLRQWYDTWYAPNNATLVIVGDVQPDAAMSEVIRYFGDIPAKPLAKRPSVQQPAKRGIASHTQHEAVNVPMLLMAYNVPTLHSLAAANQPVDTAYQLLLFQYVLDGGFAARLERRLVREQNLLASVSSHYDPYDRGDSLLFLQVVPREGVSLSTAKQAVLAQIEALKTQPISADELLRAKNNIVKGQVFIQDSVAGQAQLIGSLQASGLDDRLIWQLDEAIDTLDATDVQTAGRTYLTDDNLTLMFVVPNHQKNAL